MRKREPSAARFPRVTATDSEILVLGATGRVGGALVEALTRREQPVRAAVRDPSRSSDLEAAPGVTPVAFDVRRPETWVEALAGIRRMFLMWPPNTSPSDDLFPFVEAARGAGVERVALLSVLGADKLAILPHRKIELRLQDAGLGYVFLRAAYFMQNLSTTHADDIRERDELLLPVGDGRLAMVDVFDVAEAGCVGLLDHDADAKLEWDLTGPEALSMDEVATILSRVLDRPIRYARPGVLRFVHEHLRRGTPRGLALFMAAEYSHARLGLADRKTDRVQRALGRAPTSFASFAERERACWSA